ncbi:MAG: sensor histidine kinase [Microcella sp.]
MPLGLPPHLATSTASLAVVRGGHAAAAACLVAAAAVVVTLQYTIPDIAVWPALIVLAPMIGLLVLLDRNPSAFIGAGYLLVGGACIAWFTVIGTAQLGTVPRNDDFTVGLLKSAVILIVGVGPGVLRSISWTTAGLLVAEVSSAVVIVALGAAWTPAPGPIALWLFMVLGLSSLRLQRLRARTALPLLYRAVRDEMLAETRRGFERRATALVHDTVLNDLALIAQHDEGPLRPGIAASISADLATLVGEDWLAEDGQETPTEAADFARMLAEASAGELTVTVAGDLAALDRIELDARAEFLRAIGQALVNVRRHAGVSEAEVVIGATADDVSAMVVDAGRGFEPSPGGDGRLGVGMSILARMEAIGGEAQVWSREGSGTTIALRVPATRPVPRPTVGEGSL